VKSYIESQNETARNFTIEDSDVRELEDYLMS